MLKVVLALAVVLGTVSTADAWGRRTSGGCSGGSCSGGSCSNGASYAPQAQSFYYPQAGVQGSFYSQGGCSSGSCSPQAVFYSQGGCANGSCGVRQQNFNVAEPLTVVKEPKLSWKI